VSSRVLERLRAAPPWTAQDAPGGAGARQRRRLAWQTGFFVLFVLAPVCDVFRFDLTLGHAIVLGMDWRLGIDDFVAGRIGATEAGLRVLLRLFLPIVAGAAAFIAIAWRWGRLYCGWSCPHFSVVETINGLMRRASGRQSVWDRAPRAPRHPDGSAVLRDARWWPVTIALAVIFAFVWAVVLLSYLMPPAALYAHLLHLAPTRNEAIFIAAATVAFTLEFLFARHLFCRFGCAVGLFQSLAWMGNRGAMVVGFARDRAAACAACYGADGPGDAACEAVCPMRLKPRVPKHRMFACTQCGQCTAACATVQDGRAAPLLAWVEGDAARANEARFGLLGRRED
jgi:polyferredoxin